MATRSRAGNCKGCGVDFDSYTPGCTRCSYRHSSRRRMGSLPAATLEYEPRVCASPECSVVFLPSRKRHRYCSKRCGDPRAISKEWARVNPERQKRSSLKSWLRSQYGLTLEEYEVLLEDQLGCCAVCGTTDTSPYKRFGVDHDHQTGRVRGLLCHACNACIGRAEDDPERLRLAIAYLERER